MKADDNLHQQHILKISESSSRDFIGLSMEKFRCFLMYFYRKKDTFYEHWEYITIVTYEIQMLGRFFVVVGLLVT